MLKMDEICAGFQPAQISSILSNTLFVQGFPILKDRTTLGVSGNCHTLLAEAQQY
jgi:hypothetical protein